MENKELQTKVENLTLSKSELLENRNDILAEISVEKEKLKEMMSFQLRVRNTLSILRSDIVEQNSRVSSLEDEKSALEIENKKLENAKDFFQRQIDHLTREVSSKETEISRAENQSTVMVRLPFT